MHLGPLLERCAGGDELAWEALVRAYQGRLFGLAYQYLGRAEDARDLAQESFVRVYQNLDRLPPAESFVPWLLSLVRNACIDQLRRRKARPPAWDVPVEDLQGLHAQEEGPHADLLASTRRSLVYRALARLTDLNREIIVLKELQELSLEEIARLLELPLGTVKSRSSRARLELAEHLLEMGVGGT